MKIALNLTLVLSLGLAAAPAMADPGRDHDRKRHEHREGQHCPPGLAKKNARCEPPGHARRHDDRRGHQVGDVFRGDRYDVIRDLDRYRLQPRRDWDYYRDNDHIYRVDKDTKRILAVLNLIEAFN